MIRVCVIGNSHLACLRLGWDQIGNRYADMELTFFGAPGSTARKLRIVGDAIEPKDSAVAGMFGRTSGGKTSIVPDDYDAFLVCALRLNMTAALKLATDYRPDTFPRAPDAHLVSESFFRDALADAYRRSPAIRIIQLLNQAAPKKLTLAYPQPLPSERLGEVAPFRNAAGIRLAQIARETMQSAIGEAAVLLWQPEALTLHGICTPHAFCEGSTRLAGAQHDAEDNLHMNADYGALALTSILDRIRAGRKLPDAVAETRPPPPRGLEVLLAALNSRFK